MSWSISKSCGLSLPDPVLFKKERLSLNTKACYLRVTLGTKGVVDDLLLTRPCAARKLLMQLRSTKKKWNLPTEVRWRFMKTFVFSIMDFASYSQPFSECVDLLGKSIDQQCPTFVMGMPVNSKHANSARRTLKLLTLELRRRRQLIKLIYHLKLHLLFDPSDQRAIINWRTVTAYSTIRPIVKAFPPLWNLEDILRWWKLQLEMNAELDWGDTNRFQRNIPGCSELPPIFKAAIPGRLEKTALRWDLNRIPGSTQLRLGKE